MSRDVDMKIVLSMKKAKCKKNGHECKRILRDARNPCLKKYKSNVIINTR